MANFYTDHPEYDFYLNHPEMQRVVELKERNYADKDKFEMRPSTSRTLSRTISVCSRSLATSLPTSSSRTLRT